MRLRIGAALATVYVVWGSTYLGMAVAIRSLPPFLMSSLRFLLAGGILYAWTRRLGIQHTLALAVGLGGVFVLVDPSGHGINLVGALACLVACFSWAAGSLYIRRAPLPAEPLRAASLQMLSAGIVLAVVSAVRGESVQHVTLASAEALAYLIVIGSIVAFTAYGWLLRNAPTPLVGTYAFVNPAVAVALGWAFNGEHIGTRTIVAGAAIVVSVALTVMPRVPLPRLVPLARPQPDRG